MTATADRPTACPVCGGDLADHGADLRCTGCDRLWGVESRPAPHPTLAGRWGPPHFAAGGSAWLAPQERDPGSGHPGADEQATYGELRRARRDGGPYVR